MNSLSNRQKKKAKDMDHLLRHYDQIMFDNCSLIGPHPWDKTKPRRLDSEQERNFQDWLVGALGRGAPIYIDQGIAVEYSRGRCSNERGRCTSCRYDFGTDEPGYCEKVGEVLDAFSSGKRISLLRRYQLERFFSSKRKYHGLQKEHDLSSPDFNFLMTSFSQLEEEHNVAIVSNDKGIKKAWRDVMHEEGLSRDRFGLFIRRGFLEFEKVETKNPLRSGV